MRPYTHVQTYPATIVIQNATQAMILAETLFANIDQTPIETIGDLINQHNLLEVLRRPEISAQISVDELHMCVMKVQSAKKLLGVPVENDDPRSWGDDDLGCDDCGLDSGDHTHA